MIPAKRRRYWRRTGRAAILLGWILGLGGPLAMALAAARAAGVLP